MTDFLLELRSEEIPARMQAKAREDLAKLFAGELAKAGLTAAETITYATPRRLTLIARGLPEATEAVSEEAKGPRTSAPPQALEGFLRKTGLSQDQLVDRDGVWFAVIEKPGRATADVLAEAIPAIVRAFPWPKSMRWGDASLSTESLRWVRPLQGIVALFGHDVIDCEIAGVRSGAATVGHRFHHPGAITIGSASDYVEKLRACHVIVDHDERAGIIAMGATMLTAKAGLTLVRDEGLLAENAGLTEWPVPLLGRFDAEFLSVPPEVIQLTARVNQKYFVANDADGKLANAFVCVANIDAADGGAKIVEGNRKVLAARLSDARFFYETDLKTRLEDLTPKLEKIVFHEKLGTVADKVDRVAKLARWLVESDIVVPANAGTSGDGEGHGPHETPAFAGVTKEQLAAQADRAARLAKADLVTGMVGEFPELQGLMGGYYAAAQGESAAVANAIRDHYKPVGQGDDIPTDPVTAAVSLADKLDTLIQFFFEQLTPTGSKDPFALRRQALAILALLIDGQLKLSLSKIIEQQMVFGGLYRAGRRAGRARIYYERAAARAGEQARSLPEDVLEDPAQRQAYEQVRAAIHERAAVAGPLLLDFFADRLKVQQREAGVRHDLIDAVFALGGEDDLVRLLARVHALQSFVATPDGANLLAGYKRAANILKKEGFTASQQNPLSYTPEPVEQALIAALDSAEPKAKAAVEAEDFEGAMAALATLRAPIDAFFDAVIVNDPVPEKREARLGLLARMRDAVHAVADFSRIEG
ncbi:glycine--tRNA ligase subunit beta [Sphingomonas sp.]|uniref:glycine--tRNA ligase subunit beta n=1 Tax=Sphingomonas sp. TaxID=28214 RepID=UPI002DD66A70|nr:glycine--tRNA ligase subunit beta [Sphingomonas sp.]